MRDEIDNFKQINTIQASDFKSRVLYPYSKIENQLIEKIDCQISIFDGSIFKFNNFKEVNFTRSDFNGLKIENCIFTKVNFSNCDIKSTSFSNCEFHQCLFQKAAIQYCEFRESVFKKCDFFGTNFCHSSIHSSEFHEVLFARSLNQLNKFYDTYFFSTVLGNGSFTYNVLKNCKYENCTFSINNVAFLHGLKLSDLHSSKLYFLGEKQDMLQDCESLVDDILESYAKHKLYFAIPLTKLNFTEDSILTIFDEICFIISTFTDHKLLIDYSQIQHIVMVIEELKKEQLLPIAVVRSFRDSLLLYKNTISSTSEVYELVMFAIYRLSSVENEICDAIPLQLLAKSANCRLTFTFKKKPHFEISDFLDLISMRFSTKYKVISEACGSYIAIIESTLAGVNAVLQFITLLFGLPAVVSQAKEMKSKQLTTSIDEEMLACQYRSKHRRKINKSLRKNRNNAITEQEASVAKLGLSVGFSILNLISIKIKFDINN